MKKIILAIFCYLITQLNINAQILYVPGGYPSIGNSSPFKIYPFGDAGTSGALKLQIISGASATIIQANSDVVWADHDIIINGANTSNGNFNQFVVHRSGNIGIGTSDPQSKLEVYSNAILGSTAGNYTLLNKFYSSAGEGGNYFNDNTWLFRGGSGNNWLTAHIHKGISIDGSYGTPGVNTRTWWERAPFQDIQSFGTGNTAYLTIKAGNVGIGTVNPDAKLAVKGIIHAEEVQVDLNVPAPDYVFEKNYDLLPLSELEVYINLHKHLPEVPSAGVMEANGLNLKEMNLILLKKVEELTLHLIKINKENEASKIQNQIMKNELEAIKVLLVNQRSNK